MNKGEKLAVSLNVKETFFMIIIKEDVDPERSFDDKWESYLIRGTI